MFEDSGWEIFVLWDFINFVYSISDLLCLETCTVSYIRWSECDGRYRKRKWDFSLIFGAIEKYITANHQEKNRIAKKQ